jgi:hypothetical protein
MPKPRLKWNTRGIGFNIRRSLYNRLKRLATANAIDGVRPATMTAVLEQALEDYLDRLKAS